LREQFEQMSYAEAVRSGSSDGGSSAGSVRLNFFEGGGSSGNESGHEGPLETGTNRGSSKGNLSDSNHEGSVRKKEKENKKKKKKKKEKKEEMKRKIKKLREKIEDLEVDSDSGDESDGPTELSEKKLKRATTAFKGLWSAASEKPFEARRDTVYDCSVWQKWKFSLRNTCRLGGIDFELLISRSNGEPALGNVADSLLFAFMEKLDQKMEFITRHNARFELMDGQKLFEVYEKNFGTHDLVTLGQLKLKLSHMRFLGYTIPEAEQFLSDFLDLFNLAFGPSRNMTEEANGITTLLQAIGSNPVWDEPSTKILEKLHHLTVIEAIEILQRRLKLGVAATVRQLAEGPDFLETDAVGRGALETLRLKRRVGRAKYNEEDESDSESDDQDQKRTRRAGNVRRNNIRRDSNRGDKPRYPRRHLRCFRCDEVGHIVANCPYPPVGKTTRMAASTREEDQPSDTHQMIERLSSGLPNGSGTQTEVGTGQRRAGMAQRVETSLTRSKHKVETYPEAVKATIDSGCAQTSCLTTSSCLTNVRNVPMGTSGYEDLGGTTHAVTQVGDFQGRLICTVTGQSVPFELSGIYVAPSLGFGMLSTVHCQEQGTGMNFAANRNEVIVEQKGGALTVTKDPSNHLYEVKLEASPATKKAGLARENVTTPAIAHRRMLHYSAAKLEKVLKASEGIRLKSGESVSSYLKTGELCDSCCAGKQTSDRKSTKAASPKTEILRHHFSMDYLEGLTPSIEEHKYMLVCVEHVSSVIFVKSVESKTASRELLLDVATYFEVNNVPYTKTITLDRDGSFVSRGFTEEAKEQGFKLVYASPGAKGHFTLGKAERAVRTISDGGRGFLAASNAPAYLWNYAFENAAYVYNRCPAPGQTKSRISILRGEDVSISNIRTWGCLTYVFRQDLTRAHGRLSARGRPGILLGHSDDSRYGTMKVLLLKSHGKPVQVNRRDVKCDELRFPNLKGECRTYSEDGVNSQDQMETIPLDEYNPLRPDEVLPYYTSYAPTAGSAVNSKGVPRTTKIRGIFSPSLPTTSTDRQTEEFLEERMQLTEGRCGQQGASDDEVESEDSSEEEEDAKQDSDSDYIETESESESHSGGESHYELHAALARKTVNVELSKVAKLHGGALLSFVVSKMAESTFQGVIPTIRALRASQVSRGAGAQGRSQADNLDELTKQALKGEHVHPSGPVQANGKFPTPVTLKDFHELPLSIRNDWMRSMAAELAQLILSGTFKIVPLEGRAKGPKVITKFVWKYKSEENRLKSRLVALGFMESMDLFERNYAPTVNIESIRMVIFAAANKGWKLRTTDVTGAFLIPEISAKDKQIYIVLPEPFRFLVPDNMIIVLRRTLYGLRSSPKAWNSEFIAAVVGELGMFQLENQPCVFVDKVGDPKLMVALHVDDCLVTGEDVQVEAFLKFLKDKWKITEHSGEELTFLGMRIQTLENGFTLDLERQIEALAKDFKMEDSKSVPLPHVPSVPLQPTKKANQQHERTRELMHRLAYIANQVRPDIAFATSDLLRFSSSNDETHWIRAKRILRYLYHTRDFKLTLVKTGATIMDVFVDSNYCEENSKGRSRTGSVMLMGPNVLHYSTRIQPVIATSSTEAEYIGLGIKAKDVVYFRRCLEELGLKQDRAIPVYEDNTAAIYIGSSEISEVRTKVRHISTKYHLVKELVGKKIIKILYIPTGLQLADVFTKAVDRQTFDQVSEVLLKSNEQLRGELKDKMPAYWQSFTRHLVSLWDKVVSPGIKESRVQEFSRQAGRVGAMVLLRQDGVASEPQGEFPTCEEGGGPGFGGVFQNPAGMTAVGAGEASGSGCMSPTRTLCVRGCRRR